MKLLVFYSKYIEIGSTVRQSYGNRALAYLKKKCKLNNYIKYFKCLDDCEKTLAICPKYTKALHRKAKTSI